MKPLSVEMACFLDILNEIKEVCFYIKGTFQIDIFQKGL